MALSTQDKITVLSLRSQGLSFAKIASQMKISKQTAVDVVGEHREQVATLQALQLEALYEETKINLKGRIEQLSALQHKLREEIESRDLSDVPTDKLITLYLNVTKNIKDEVIQPDMETSSEQAMTARRRSYFNQ